MLDEGLFVASYKFALLLSLADVAVEDGDEPGSSLIVTTKRIGEKVGLYYWRQAVPYHSVTASEILRQNTGPQAATVNLINAFREQRGPFLTSTIKASRPEAVPLSRQAHSFPAFPADKSPHPRKPWE
jgi:hypothetical protein